MNLGRHFSSRTIPGFFAALVLAAACGRETPFTPLPEPQRIQTSNSYFDAFLAENATPEKLRPPMGDGILRAGDVALTPDGSIVTVATLFADGRVEAVSGGIWRVYSGLVALQNGAHELYAGRTALTPSNQVVTVMRVFADGRAQVRSISGGISVESGLTPEALGRYSGWALNTQNRIVTLMQVFKDGRAQVRDENGSIFVDWNLVPRRNGSFGLKEGNSALTRENTRVTLRTVFADGRAQVLSTNGTLYLTRDLTPAVSEGIR